jgi:PAS domain S-box-containing protein
MNPASDVSAPPKTRPAMGWAFAVFLLMLIGLPFVLYATLARHAVTESLSDARALSQVISQIRTYYADNVAGRLLDHTGPATLTERYREVAGGIPIPATLSIELADAITDSALNSSVAFAFVSDAPFRNRVRPGLDPFQQEALALFRDQPQRQDVWRQVEGADGQTRLRLAIPVVMKDSCVACHNGHPDSPVRTWKVGDVRGLQDIAVQVSVAGQASDSTWLGLYLLGLMAATLWALRDYRQGNRALQVANGQLQASREHLEDLAATLRRQSREQGVVLDSANSGIVHIDDQRRLVWANRRLHQLFGWPEGSLVGQTTRVWYADEAGWELGAQAYPALWRGEMHRRDQELVRRDGSRFWARLTARAVDPRHPEQGAVWVIDDITEEHRVSQALAAAKALAEQSDRAKTQFLANVGHEFRTPMNAVLGMAYLAQQTELDPRQREYLARIQASGQQLMGLINDILDYAKLESGAVRIEQQPFDLTQLMEATCSSWRQAAQDKGLAFDCTLPADLPRWLVGDPQRLGQVLGQLLSNALKFTQQGGVTARVSAVAAGEHWDLRFQIRDTGVGMTAEQIGRLFRRFEQGDGSSTRAFGGVGLGLVIAKRLSELMGGALEVDSTPGTGSVFCLALRLRAVPPTEQPISSDTRLPPAVDPVSVPEPPAPAPGTPDAQAWAERLLALVQAGDAEAMPCLNAGAVPLAAWLGAADFAALRNALQTYDFERAQRLLQQALMR